MTKLRFYKDACPPSCQAFLAAENAPRAQVDKAEAKVADASKASASDTLPRSQAASSSLSIAEGEGAATENERVAFELALDLVRSTHSREF